MVNLVQEAIEEQALSRKSIEIALNSQVQLEEDSDLNHLARMDSDQLSLTEEHHPRVKSITR